MTTTESRTGRTDDTTPPQEAKLEKSAPAAAQVPKMVPFSGQETGTKSLKADYRPSNFWFQILVRKTAQLFEPPGR